MKKLLIPLLLLSLLLAACAKAPDPLPLATDGPNTVEGKVTFTLVDCYRAATVAPSIPSGNYQVYDAPAGTEYIVAVMDVENHSDFGYQPNGLLSPTVTAGEAVHTPICLVLTDGGATLTENAKLPGGSTNRLYYLFTPDTQEGLTLTVTVDGQPYSAPLTPADEPKMTRTELGQTLTGNDLAVTLDSFHSIEKLRPSDPAPLYDFFDAGTGKTHLTLKTTVTNHGAQPVSLVHMAGVTVGTTVCTPIMESADGTALTTEGTLEPGQTRTVYFAAVFDADQTGKKATVTIGLYGETFRTTATATKPSAAPTTPTEPTTDTPTDITTDTPPEITEDPPMDTPEDIPQ